MMRDSNLFFLLLAACALVAIAILAWRGLFASRVSRIAIGLLIAGICGNLTDRILHGSVVDFLSFDLHVPFANPWPAFNVADASIFCAVLLFLWEAWTQKKRDA